MGTTCSTHWENKKYINSSGQKTITGREISKVYEVDRRIILEWVLRDVGWKGVDWMHLLQVRD
jgi:hypothetical protein